MKKIYPLFFCIYFVAYLSLSAQNKSSIVPFKKIKIACIGNSITAGVGASDREKKGYVGVMAEMLGEGYDVRNYGVSGATTCRGTHKPYVDLPAFMEAKEFQPDIVTIALGTNDSQPKVWNADNFAENFEKDLVFICNEFINLSSKPTVYLCIPIPIVPNERWPHQPQVLLNEIIPIIKKVAEEKGLKTIDLYTPLIGKPQYYEDMLHPNDVGHRVIAEQIYRTLKPGYDFSKLKREKLNRGLVAIREDDKTVNICWRYLSSDLSTTTFNIYRNGKKINVTPIAQSTYFKDTNAPKGVLTYEVRPVEYGIESAKEKFSYTLKDTNSIGYLNIPLNIPPEGITPNGQSYSYQANDASVGDVDGDGEYEIILKWEPTNAHDNAHDGYTGNVYIDCYKLNGRQLWRIDLGKNIRAGAHYTQFMVFDLDGDLKAEVVMKTADGTIDGEGNVIGNEKADYRNKNGRILEGPEFLTVFEGSTGQALQTIDYIPQRGRLEDWGDSEGNRSDRFLACVAYLDGEYPSVVMCRGYYTRTVLAAFDWKNKKLTNRWVFDSNTKGNEAYAGQGNHNLRVGDIDGDGYDEIVYGACAIDHNGQGLYSTGLGHGDALHLTAFDPSSKKLQVWDCHENRKDGSTFRDAETGNIIFQVPSNTDVGRCMAADIDHIHKGVEMWSLDSHGIRNIKGEVINPSLKGVSINMACWWDGDLTRELLDGTRITKYDYLNGDSDLLFDCEACLKNNGTKSNPCFCADILGDWREEVIWRTKDNKNLRIYITPYETPYKFYSLMEDPIYRISAATQNVAYNQPTQAGYYFGSDLGKIFPQKEIRTTEDKILLDAGMDYDSYKWSNGETSRMTILDKKSETCGKPIEIELEVTYKGGKFNDQINVTFLNK
jgi:rhamnogalacturonan endolyase